MYVIMLNDYEKDSPDEWPISGENQDIKVLEQQTQHDGQPHFLSKQLYGMLRVGPKSLVNVHTGKSDCGGIYKVLDIVEPSGSPDRAAPSDIHS